MNANKNIRRVVTGHDEAGKAVIIIDDTNPNLRRRSDGGNVGYGMWMTESSPARADLMVDTWDPTRGVPPATQGSNFVIIDFPPSGDPPRDIPNDATQARIGAAHASPKARPPRHPAMHRTRTVDYALILGGEIDMLLDDSEVHLKAGDVVIQQATNHAWVNRGTEPCRIAFILIDAEEPLR